MAEPPVELRGVRTHNLRNLDVDVRRGAITAVVGLSGSGKSSLAVDTLAAEGLRRNLLLSDPARSGAALPVAADYVGNLPPTYCFAGARTDDTALGTSTSAYIGLWQGLISLFVRLGETRSPVTGAVVRAMSAADMVERVLALDQDEKFLILAPLGLERGSFESQLDAARAAGFVRVRIDSEVYRLDEGDTFGVLENAERVALVIDRVRGASAARWSEAIDLALKWSDLVRVVGSGLALDLQRRPVCAESGWIAPIIEERLFALSAEGTLSASARSVFLWDRSSEDVLDMTFDEARHWLRNASSEDPVTLALQQEAVRRIEGVCRLGLASASLRQPLRTLSSGQRNLLALSRALCADLRGALLVFDEISTGVHPMNIDVLAEVLRELAEANTVVLVEHRPELIARADDVLEVGPGAGKEGGMLVYSGPLEDFLRFDSATSRHVRHFLRQDRNSSPTASNIVLTDGNELVVEAGAFICLRSAGPEKSLLLENHVRSAFENIKEIARVVMMDSRQVYRSLRSVAATTLGVMDPLRSLFASLPDSRVRGYNAARFSFNVAGGRCETCEGTGYAFARDALFSVVTPPCPACRGERYEPGTLEIRYRGLRIADVLALPLREAQELFANHKKIAAPIHSACDLGVGYLTLGRTTQSISNGELQRLWLAKELAKRSKGKVAYLFDEPTSGLHPDDAERFVTAALKLCAAGHSVVVASVDPIVSLHASRVYDCDAFRFADSKNTN